MHTDSIEYYKDSIKARFMGPNKWMNNKFQNMVDNMNEKFSYFLDR